ncbi:Mannan endo-1,6-alpha-mannosidase [Lachnellula hyalina]|uniref:Mannan endo-1,6-alpha-mannosidase n=1 Tax=Lachnellula hyalina TaxID=1316788 RepID=A0A8H8R9J3_9HELO|nr:Mannan endo-1,6-alpha-mannosidase [Lachnellula hyalina]TVY31052.1 Mannan endo-1,6-alpha-mannosidase [Lachnellula hyalina]
MFSSTKSQLHSLAICFIGVLDIASGITLDVKNQSSLLSATHTIAHDLMSYYTGSQPNSPSLGVLSKPYYWWEAGAMWGTMISYWHYTNDSTYVTDVGLAILSQAGPNNDFIMANQVFDTGNDDQAFWALTAMSAVEYAFPVPITNTSTSPAPTSNSNNPYLTLAINTFNEFVTRWNTTQCNGGLKWQFTPSNAGFDYKSTISNGGFFQLAARLALHTGNATYREWAEKEWDWMTGVGFINETTWAVIDGAGDDNGENCTVLSTQQWTYNNAIFLYGAAVMTLLDNANTNTSASNSTSPSPSTSPPSIWLTRTKGLLGHATSQFFTPSPNATSIMYESQCETTSSCNTDQYSFKAYLSRWMTTTALLIPSLQPDILALLTPSAQAAALACSGAGEGSQSLCGTKWYVGGCDGVTGVGQEMSALEVLLGVLGTS